MRLTSLSLPSLSTPPTIWRPEAHSSAAFPLTCKGVCVCVCVCVKPLWLWVRGLAEHIYEPDTCTALCVHSWVFDAFDFSTSNKNRKNPCCILRTFTVAVNNQFAAFWSGGKRSYICHLRSDQSSTGKYVDVNPQIIIIIITVLYLFSHIGLRMWDKRRGNDEWIDGEITLTWWQERKEILEYWNTASFTKCEFAST